VEINCLHGFRDRAHGFLAGDVVEHVVVIIHFID
jgi:hypothetical protein